MAVADLPPQHPAVETPPQPLERKEEAAETGTPIISAAQPPRNKKRNEAKARLRDLLARHQLRVIAIGNGTACRETEELVSELMDELEKHGTEEEQGQGDRETGRQGDKETGRQGDKETRRQGDKETGGQGDKQVDESLPVSLSPCLPASVSLPAVQSDPAPLTREHIAELSYVIVNQAGAHDYSGGAIGREEFPNHDAPLRSAISLGRRLQDPLSEWVKVDPYNIGVGLYQHDVNPRYLKESLETVIESCVNHVGVDVNTAGVSLLRHVSGLNQVAGRELVEYRTKNGPFRNREQLLQVPGMNPARYQQAAGFLTISGGDNPLDRTAIHPESYGLARQLLAELGFSVEALLEPDRLNELREKIRCTPCEPVAVRLQLRLPALYDLLDELLNFGGDPRDKQPAPIFRRRVLRLEDLQQGMELQGVVLNVVDFGAFIDVGLPDSGLVHISQLANRYIKSPYEVVTVGQVVTVWVLAVDQSRGRVSLTMIRPGTPRRSQERKPQEQRREQGSRPPRGRRPARQQAQAGTPAAQETAQQPAGQEGAAPAAATAGAPPRTQQRRYGRQGDRRQHRPPLQQAAERPAPPPRRPPRPRPKPKLSQAALEGAAPLRTFSELAAFLEAKEKQQEPTTAAPPTPEAQPPTA
jgi:uncharacterized protein